MRQIKFGFVLGVAVGYYFGTAAGKERHEQLKSFIARVSSSTPVHKATAEASTQVHKATDKVTHKLHRNKLGETTEFMPS